MCWRIEDGVCGGLPANYRANRTHVTMRLNRRVQVNQQAGSRGKEPQ